MDGDTGGWNTQDIEEIVRGRRMRVGRRRSQRRVPVWAIIVVLIVLAGAGAAAYVWLHRPSNLAALPDPAVVAPGGFRASIGADKTITVGLEIRNVTNVPVTVLRARVAAPVGLTSTALTVIPPGPNNEGFALDGPLPAATPVVLGTDSDSRDAIVAARFTVDCSGLLATPDAFAEEIFVTIQLQGQTREVSLTPPVVGDDLPWLTGTAQRACTDPVPTVSAEQPLPPLPDNTGGPGGGASSTP